MRMYRALKTKGVDNISPEESTYIRTDIIEQEAAAWNFAFAGLEHAAREGINLEPGMSAKQLINHATKSFSTYEETVRHIPT